MPHAENKVDWCIKKAEKELKETGKHRGLVNVIPFYFLALQLVGVSMGVAVVSFNPENAASAHYA
jgi:hypothetical protein